MGNNKGNVAREGLARQRWYAAYPLLQALTFIVGILLSTQSVALNPFGALQFGAAALVILPMDEGSGSSAQDTSGNGNDGALVNGPIYKAISGDGSAFSVQFDGTDDYLDLGPIDVTGSLSLAAWFNADSFPGSYRDPRIISKASGVSSNDHVFMLGTIRAGSKTRLRARVRVNGSTTTLIASSGDLSAGVWQHAAATYDGVRLRLYLDAVEVGSTALTGPVDVDPGLSVAVGSQSNGVGRWFDGLIDDVRILDRAMAQNELTALVAGNAPAVALDDSYSGTEDSALSVATAAGVLANDSDPELDPLQAALVGDASSGLLTLNSDGSFDYSPNPNFSGTDTFTYQANDGTGNSNVATITLSIQPVNDAPVASPDDYTTAAGSTLTIGANSGVLFNDSDLDNDTLQAVLLDDVDNGALQLAADGSFTYTPTGAFSGTDMFSYAASDAVENSNSVTVSITVSAGAPLAVLDSYATNEDESLVVAAGLGVLANDLDNSPPANLVVSLLNNTTNGALALNADGGFTYTPNPNANGSDSFAYQITDPIEGLSAQASVMLLINAVNDAPVALPEDYSTEVDLPLSVDLAVGVLANDTDVDGDLLQAVLLDDVSNGDLQFLADGSFTYMPNVAFSGIDSFTYQANDAAVNSNVVTVSIDVSTSSDPQLLASLPLDEGVGSTALDTSGNGNNGVLINSPTYQASTGDGSAFALRFDGADDYVDLGPIDVGGNLSLAAWINADSFPGSSRDPRIISKASSVSGSDHVFMLGTIKAGTKTRLRARVRVNGSTTTLIAGSGDLSTSVWHHVAATYDGADLRLYLDAVEVGSVALSGSVDVDPNLSVAVGSQSNGSARWFDGLIDDVRILERAMAPSELTSLVAGSAPILALDDSYLGIEDITLSIGSAVGLLVNDNDPESDPLQAFLVGDVSNGSLTLNLDGSFNYVPNPNFDGIDSFSYQASDGSGNSNVATATLSMQATGDAPVAAPESYATGVDITLSIGAIAGVLANDTDVDGDLLQAILDDDVDSGDLLLNANGSFTYTPDLGYSGTDSFTYRANDAVTNSNVVTVTIDISAVGDLSILASLPMDDGVGTSALDISGKGNNGTLISGPTYEASSGDGSAFSIRFDGTDDYVDLGPIDVSGNLTLAAWFNADSFPGSSRDPRIISKASSVSGSDHVFMLGTIKVGSKTRLRARVRVNGSTSTLIASSGDLGTEVWQHAAVTYDGADLRLYLDAIEVGSLALSGPVDVDPSLSVSVGSQSNGANRWFDGLIDDVRILERAMGPSELAVIAAGDLTPMEVLPPQSLSAIPVSMTRIDLHWTGATGPGLSFDVYRDTVFLGTVTTTKYTDDTATLGTAHSYEVFAKDITGMQSTGTLVVGSSIDTTSGAWWDTNWPYRTLLSVVAGSYERQDKVVGQPVNFTSVLAGLGAIGAPDLDKIRCLEVDASGQLVGAEAVCQFDRGAGFNLQTNAAGQLSLLAEGVSPANAARYFHVYFDVVGGTSTASTQPSSVLVADNVFDQGQSSFRITTSNAEYFYHKQGGGFSSLLDVQSADWINYSPTGGSSGSYRGIPNLVYPAGHFHPGATSSTSTLVNSGPIKATIHSATNDGWEVMWEIYPSIATLTVLAVPTSSNYWFLYEGTPGGILEPSSDFSVTSDGTARLLSRSWTGDIAQPEWIYFADPVANRSLFVSHNQDDTEVDSYRPLDGVMTVLGIGRSGANSFMSDEQNTFSIGLIETTDFIEAQKQINSQTQPIEVLFAPAVSRP